MPAPVSSNSRPCVPLARACIRGIAPLGGSATRKDPVQSRVAIPAADPPDNRSHGPRRRRATCGAMCLPVVF
ncbi:hypothetical protein EO081_03725 [Sphingomonas desiccabilis]|uniref:Uncharacterized protein n=1 Tax=Sphingomonas desiccabilis TaxID=429134 RepID=A0A4V1QPS1_9SPHN|nr:hypothetical protein EO081_03725 [Sphingomonas desiccabilis]